LWVSSKHGVFIWDFRKERILDQFGKCVNLLARKQFLLGWLRGYESLETSSNNPFDGTTTRVDLEWNSLENTSIETIP
jgi:hypothetical protein